MQTVEGCTAGGDAVAGIPAHAGLEALAPLSPGLGPLQTIAKPLNGHIPPRRDAVVLRTDAFAPAALDGTGLHASNVTFAEVHGPTLPRLVSAYIIRNGCDSLRSLALAARVGPKEQHKGPLTEASLGLGTHWFQWQGHELWAVQQAVGAPVGTGVGAAQYENLVLVARGRGRGAVDLLRSFCHSLIAESECSAPGTYSLFRWDVQSQAWCLQGSRTARHVGSVVLPQQKKDHLLNDIEEFLSPATRLFYLSHGIPYRRAYLFHGLPGTGKTSLIQALAGRHERNICVMQPTDPAFTDDMLKAAVCNAPARSIIVLEDIDALFTRSRQSRGKSAVTFAGLLNALDGVGMPEGQVFMLTTNFRDQLDDALVRNGRVDYHLEFGHATHEVCREMFGQFYPAAREGPLPALFASALRRDLGDAAERLTPAMLQHFFVVRRKLPPEEAVAEVRDVAADLRERERGNAAAAELVAAQREPPPPPPAAPAPEPAAAPAAAEAPGPKKRRVPRFSMLGHLPLLMGIAALAAACL